MSVTGNPGTLFDGELVTLTFPDDSTDGLTGNTAVADANGVATFPMLSIATTGDYQLKATAAGESVTSDSFKIGDGILGCGDTTPNVNGVTVERWTTSTRPTPASGSSTRWIAPVRCWPS